MVKACGHVNNVGPFLHIALTLAVVSRGNQGAVRPQADGVVASGGNGNNVLPAADLALAVLVFAHRHHGAVRL